jgi:hypothetical protein
MDWKVYIEYRPDRLRTYLYITRIVGTGLRELLVEGGSKIVTLKDGEILDKDVTHFAEFDDEHLMRLVVEALDKRGIKAPAQSYTEGKLEATTEHLQDLRKLIPKLRT